MASYIPDSLPNDSQPQSQRYNDYVFEATQLSQPHFSQTQNTQNTTFANSQVEPRKKYWATFIPTNSSHSILKIPWAKPVLQIGRGPYGMSGNDVVLQEKRISNRHCKITLGIRGENSSEGSRQAMQAWKDGDSEPEVWIEDMNSSNGTFVNGTRIKTRLMLQHGDEISLGHASTLDNHDVRYIYRSVGQKGQKLGRSKSKGGLEMVGAVYERYQILDKLGSGTFAEVRKAVDVETGDMRAIKQIVKHRFAGNEKTLELFQREMQISKALQHENICRLIESFEDPQHICLVLEYVDGGDLLDFIMNWPGENGAGLPEPLAATLTLQICRAMAYTHEMGVTHRDLKPENILLTKETSDSPQSIKIADFGLAKMVHSATMLTSMVGTPQYLAPEVVMQSRSKPGYENVVDSWSVGIIVYSMLTKALPFDEDGEMPVDKRIKARFTQPFDRNLLETIGASTLAIDFISRLLAKLPNERMTMSEALEHEWLAGPSSQHSESQPVALGGDSMWDINSFDDNEREEDLFTNGGDMDSDDEGRWTRPATVSGTNMESAIGGGTSDESFSQPMENLRLATPGMFSLANGAGRSGMNGPTPIPIPFPNQNNQAPHADMASPPSPPLTDEPMSSSPNGNINHSPALDVVVEKPNGVGGTEPMLTPGQSEHGNGTNKRKMDGGAFSSGSLSPPPPDSQDAQLKNGDEAMDVSGTKTKTPTPRKGKGGAGTAKGKRINANGTAKPTSEEPELSPRRSTRPRKSVRLM